MSKRVLVIGGSVRQEESRSNLLVDVIDELARNLASSTVVWKLGYKPLPLAQHAWHKDPGLSNNENVSGLATAIAEADVIALVSPIYNGSYSGALKNALDCMLGDAFRGKQIVLASVGSDATGLLPCLHLQDVARTMRGQVYSRFTVVDSNNSIDFEKMTVTESVRARLTEIMEEVTA